MVNTRKMYKIIDTKLEGGKPERARESEPQ